ncbi:MAG: hypothetical protein CM1200mP6_05140 [Anaerolineaceae bacterium]|nr:MAG: hypothetical protein CM1200mP6_05140 [Anaerolineaceae bacterium]
MMQYPLTSYAVTKVNEVAVTLFGLSLRDLSEVGRRAVTM